MSFTRISLLAATALMTAALATGASAASITKTTVVTTEPIANAVPIDFMAFDRNHDGVLSANEIGAQLFYIFDADGNEVIDNIEFDQARVYTVGKVKKETTFSLDLNDDGIPDQVSTDVDYALEQSHLARFNNGGAKLSAREFIGDSFLRLDVNDDKAIDLKEWKQAYAKSVRPETAIQERYN
jgi:hypothetical protein